jgi:FHA domain-containing protein
LDCKNSGLPSLASGYHQWFGTQRGARARRETASALPPHSESIFDDTATAAEIRIMKLTVNRRTDAQPFPAIEAVFLPPGGTIGRAAENQLSLPDTSNGICRIQAAMRFREGGWRLANLSGMSTVAVNGQVLSCAQELVLENGDELEIGAYVLHVGADAVDTEVSTPRPDVFSDLLGPGTLPVASLSELTVHPFDMESAASRNPDDPLAQLPTEAWRGDEGSRDPLALFPDTDPHTDHALSDSTPAMLPARDPLASRPVDPIGDTLRRRGGSAGQDPMRDDAPEYGNPMTPPKVRR